MDAQPRGVSALMQIAQPPACRMLLHSPRRSSRACDQIGQYCFSSSRPLPLRCERLGETSNAAAPAMNSRRFIRCSSQLEEAGAEYQVSMVVALGDANAASQSGEMAHARRCGSEGDIWVYDACRLWVDCVEKVFGCAG